MIPDDHFRKAANDPAFMESLLGLLTEKRRSLFERVLALRTRHICAVLENVSDSHNTNAVIRSCEALGIQDIHIISEEGFQTAKRILIGSGKWVDLIRYSEKTRENAEYCLQRLKEKGYTIAVTVPRPGAQPMDAMEVASPLAVCFGHERSGISETLARHADAFITIPMSGFTESFNVSVAAGIVFSSLMRKVRNSGVGWRLSEVEKNELRLKWALKCIRKPDAVFNRLMKSSERLNAH